MIWSFQIVFLVTTIIIICIVSPKNVCQAWMQQQQQPKRQQRPFFIWHCPRNSIICHHSTTTDTAEERNEKPPPLKTETATTARVVFHPDTSASAQLQAEDAVASLAATTVALLAGNEEEALALSGSASQKRQMIHDAFTAYDVCESGTLSVAEAKALFTNLARSIVMELASDSSSNDDQDDAAATNNSSSGKSSDQEEVADELKSSSVPSSSSNSKSKAATTIKSTTTKTTRDVARSHAARVLAADEAGDTISRVATKLLLLADTDGDGKISLLELSQMFETVHQAPHVDTFPQPLRALAGSLQLLPPTEGTNISEASNKTSQWNVGVPGDDHTLRRVVLIPDQLSVIGLGRSADASAYFLPELGIVLDAGIQVKSLAPKLVCLTHGHRDHIAALPVHAQTGATILAPAAIAPLVRRYLLAEAQLNYGDPTQTDDETVAALGEFSIQSVEDGYEQLLPKNCYTGSPTPLGIQVFEAPHKTGVPAVSYGLYRAKNRLKKEYASLPKNELGSLLRNDVVITESYNEGILFYTGDTTIDLLRNRWEDILPKYKYMIHEVTFLGQPSTKLDQSTQRKGHTHYAQLHPWICAFPDTTFICVHWSLRYSKDEILNFFEDQYGGVPKNVVLWL